MQKNAGLAIAFLKLECAVGEAATADYGFGSLRAYVAFGHASLLERKHPVPAEARRVLTETISEVSVAEYKLVTFIRAGVAGGDAYGIPTAPALDVLCLAV